MNDLYDVSYTQNRELSWLKFNERVLKEALDKSVGLLERLKFLAIFQSNLDEFYMIRVGSLTDISLLKKNHTDNKSNLTSKEQLKCIYQETARLNKQKDKVFFKLSKALSQQGIEHTQINDCSAMELKYIEDVFKKDISPLLSPSIIDAHHPFPHLLNKQKVVVASLVSNSGFETIGVIPVSDNLPQMIRLPRETTSFVLMEDILMAFFKKVFKQYDVSHVGVICITRNADVHLDDEYIDFDMDLRLQMKKIIRKRERLSPVRLEVNQQLSDFTLTFLKEKLRLTDMHVHTSESPLDFSYVYTLIDQATLKQKTELLYAPYVAVYPSGVNKDKSIMEAIYKKDVLLSYPYDDVDAFLQLLKEAAFSSSVTSIKISIYRLANNSQVVQYLREAAENGKEVIVLIELRARFDERNNIDVAEILEQAGCKLIYGFEEYKVHAKCLSITMIKNKKVSYISGVSTGNFNEKTNRLYADFLLLTAHQGIGEDIHTFFTNMGIANLQGSYRYLSVSPMSFKMAILHGIDQEIAKAKKGLKAKILFKCNSLTDRDIIDKLQEASNHNVSIDLIIRGICCLVPNVKDKTENIRVVSVVGRFLEHARVYCFGEGDMMKMMIASGDLMTRSTTRRVEVGTWILDQDVIKQIHTTLLYALRDNIKGRQLNKFGNYQKVKHKHEEAFDSQQQQIRDAQLRKTTPLRPVVKESTTIFKKGFALLYQLLKRK